MVSHEPDVAVAKLPSLTPHSPMHRAQCLGVCCLSSRLSPTVPNTPHVTPKSSVSRPAANIDIDPLIEPFPAVTVSHTAQVSSAPDPATVSAPLLSLPNVSQQTLSVPLPPAADDTLSPEDIIAAKTSLMIRMSGSSRDTSISLILMQEECESSRMKVFSKLTISNTP